MSTNTATFRAAIIGCGPSGPARGGAHSISYAHARAIRNTDRRLGGGVLTLAAAASRGEKNLADFLAEFTPDFPALKGYLDYKAMLAAERPGFVIVCAFPPDREEMVNLALENGAKILLVEKPFAVSMGAAKRMIAAAKAKGARIFTHFQRRYGASFEWVKTRIAEGRIGRVTSAQIIQPGPQLINFGPHLIDTVLNTLPGGIRPVSALAGVEASGPYQGVESESNLAGLVRFSDGTHLTVESGNDDPERVPIIRFNGDAGFAELRLSPLPGEPGVARGRFTREAEISVLDSDENFHHGPVDTNLYIDRAFADIVEATLAGKPTRIDAEAVLPGTEILLALFESAKTGKLVSFPLQNQESPF